MNEKALFEKVNKIAIVILFNHFIEVQKKQMFFSLANSLNFNCKLVREIKPKVTFYDSTIMMIIANHYHTHKRILIHP